MWVECPSNLRAPELLSPWELCAGDYAAFGDALDWWNNPCLQWAYRLVTESIWEKYKNMQLYTGYYILGGLLLYEHIQMKIWIFSRMILMYSWKKFQEVGFLLLLLLFTKNFIIIAIICYQAVYHVYTFSLFNMMIWYHEIVWIWFQNPYT